MFASGQLTTVIPLTMTFQLKRASLDERSPRPNKYTVNARVNLLEERNTLPLNTVDKWQAGLV